jgi:hypothetical protein
MSLMSFVLGLLYLNHSNGAAMSMLTKCVARTARRQHQAATGSNEPESGSDVDGAEGPFDSSAANGASSAANGAGTSQRQKPVRLFYFAM